MKKLIVVRHAKSSWAEEGLSDIDRPLNDRGKKDAPEMARRLKEKDIKIDLFISSPAKRAKRTACYFAKEYKVDKKNIVLLDKLYTADLESFYDAIQRLSNDEKTVALFSHNPGITEFVNTLSNIRVDNMPTCGVFAVQSEAESWADFKASEKNFLFFDYPKNPQY
jgi:phosphohistidine phosphatase